MLINLPKIQDPRGNLSFIQGGDTLPFEIERCYWIYDVPGGEEREGRALKRTSELIVALSGSFDVITDDGHGHRETTHLCRSYKGLLINPMHWREIVNFSTNSVALVLASTTYDEADYIRQYDQFIRATEASPAVCAPPQQQSPAQPLTSRIIDLPRHGYHNGNLTEIENTGACPFAMRRVYYLYDVPADTTRGGHSHKHAQSLLVAVSGSFSVTTDDGSERKTHVLNRPYQALYIPNGVWRTVEDFSGGSVCLVISSDKYDEDDYERDYDKFLASKENCARSCRFLDLGAVNAPYATEIKAALSRVVDSGQYIGGPEVETLELKLAQLTQVPYCVAVSNGLDALRLILRGYKELGRLNDGDEVLVSADTFVATVLAITDSGLRPVMVDADWRTMNMDTSKLEAALTPRTRAVMPVHLYGLACWDSRLVRLARDHGLLVIEDNAQALGAVSPTPGLFGTCRTGGLGHAAGVSFYPTKNLGALGDAGAITTHDPDLAAVTRALRNYGTDRPYHNIYAGLNCRMDPMQAAILNVKMQYLEKENALRRRNALSYTESIYNPNIVKPLWPSDVEQCVWHQYVVRVADRDGFRRYMSDKGVETSVHYPLPPHRQPCYRDIEACELPIADLISRQCVSLPVSSATSVEDVHDISLIINGYRAD